MASATIESEEIEVKGVTSSASATIESEGRAFADNFRHL